MNETSARKILVVEDSDVQAVMLTHFLNEKGYSVEWAKNGAEGLDKINLSKPDLIISDILMPIMDGFELCQRIKGHEIFGDIPVILVSVLQEPEEVIRGLVVGANNYVAKPYDPDYLMSKVELLLTRPDDLVNRPEKACTELRYGGKMYEVNSTRVQTMSFLLSIYENAIKQNKDLQQAQMELKVLNETLKGKNNELEELAKIRAEFVSTASHDLRAPLTGILGFAELLLRGKAEPLGEKQKHYINTVYQSGKELLNIIEDFLELSRIDAGRLRIDKQRFDVAEGVQRAVASLESLFAAKNIHLTSEIQEGAPAAYADPNRFNQMLTNYLSNALKFTPEGGIVTVKSEAVTEGRPETADRRQEFVRVSVTDTGIGIRQEDLSKLFQRFSQLEEAKYSAKGTGLGLAIVKQLAGMQGGGVGVESEFGKGSTFWFTLPVFKEEPGKR